MSAPALHRAQLQKLVVNAVINPLTALSRCKNQDVAKDPTLLALAEKLIRQEIGPIVRALLEDQDDQFSDSALLKTVLAVAQETGSNTSSMLQDVMGGRRTEVEWINGFLVREGRRLELRVDMNERLVELVERRGRGEGIEAVDFGWAEGW